MGERLRLALLTSLVASAIACTSGPPPPVATGSYDADIRAWRTAKDDEFKHAAASPIREEQRAAFQGLPYFDIDPAFRVPASLVEEQSDPPIVVQLPNSANQLEQKVRVGTLQFSLNGAAYKLTAFAEDIGAIRRLWVPFRDATSGDSTYGGGRYLDLDRNATGHYDVDFNRAYHPYCVYNVDYVCPVPPRENTLPIAVRAGERMP